MRRKFILEPSFISSPYTFHSPFSLQLSLTSYLSSAYYHSPSFAFTVLNRRSNKVMEGIGKESRRRGRDLPTIEELFDGGLCQGASLSSEKKKKLVPKKKP